jgi:hypothetical protein
MHSFDRRARRHGRRCGTRERGCADMNTRAVAGPAAYGVVRGGYGEGTPGEMGYRAKCTVTAIWECTASTTAPGPQHGSPYTTISGGGALWR